MANNYARNVIALKQLKGIGNGTILKIPKDKLINAQSIDDLKTLTNSTVAELSKAIEYSEQIIKDCTNYNINIISDTDQNYPKYLLKVKDHPPILFAKGNLELLNQQNTIAIVGSRKALPESINLTKEISKHFIEQDFVIVSGLAEGIDTQAHKTAIEYKGKTIAVLPSDIINIYPATNKQLAQQILDNNGLLLSEYPINSKMGKYNFIDRDKIQSGLSLGVFVVESKIDGGTMHTANFCQKHERLLIVLNNLNSELNSYFSGNQELLLKMKQTNNIIDYKKNIEINNYITENTLRDPQKIDYNTKDKQIQQILQQINNIKGKLLNNDIVIINIEKIIDGTLKYNDQLNDAYYLFDYFPKYLITRDHDSEDILKVKSKDATKLDYFKLKLLDVLDHKCKFTICTIPSSHKEETNGITIIAKELCKSNINWEDGTEFIKRTKDIPQKHLGGYPEYEREEQSIVIDKEKIEGKLILVLDDICTKGQAIDIIQHKLKDAKAKKIIIITLGKTKHNKTEEEYLEKFEKTRADELNKRNAKLFK